MIDGVQKFHLQNVRHRLFAKRPTQVAREDDAHLPLHVQFPPLPKLSWNKADEIIRTAATAGEERVWFETTRAYRDADAARVLYSTRPKVEDVTSDALLFGNDLQQLIHSNFAIDPRLTVKQFESDGNFAYVKLFPVIEMKPEGHRRREIAWPRSCNVCEQKIVADLLQFQHAKVRWYSAVEVRDRGVRLSFAASIDFKKFFQQFELITKQFFAFQFQGQVYFLSSIPTGAVFPPIFAQALSRAILAMSVRKAGVEHLVEFDCCIDNLRLCSDNLHALWAAWHEMLHTCNELGATIGETNPPPIGVQSSYTYLGILFHAKNLPTASLSEKSLQKIESAIGLLSSRREVLVVDVLAIFGQTVWASTVTDFKLGNLYHVIKFVRRIQRRDLDEVVSIWPSIVELWISSLKEMKTKVFTFTSVENSVVIFTDASDDGWGVVIVNLEGCSLRVFAGKWSDEERKSDINVRELRAVRIGMRILGDILKQESSTTGVHLRIDNTTARAWTLRSRAPKFEANQIALDIDREASEFNLKILTADYVPSARNISDAASRMFSKTTASAQQVGEIG